MSSHYDRNIFFSIPELQQIFASHLPRGDLFKCILVSTSWYNTFLPYLWKSYSNTNNKNRKFTLSVHSKDEEKYKRDIIAAKRVFGKHAHLIKDLTTTFEFLVEVIDDFANIPPPPQRKKLSKLSTRPVGELTLNSITIGQGYSNCAVWIDGVNTDAIVQQSFEFICNQKQLKSLTILERQVYGEYDVSWEQRRDLTKCVFNNLKSLTSLTDLNMKPQLKYLQFPPNIKRYTGTSLSYDTEFAPNNMREVKLTSNIHIDVLANLLASTPGLYSMSIGNIVFESNSPTDIETKYQGFSSQLKILDFNSDEKPYYSMIMPLILSLVPDVVEISGKFLPLELSHAIAEKCRLIKKIRIYQEKENPNLRIRRGLNKRTIIVDTITPLLTSCLHLEILDTRFLSLDATNASTQPWVCDNLEELHCQVGGFYEFEAERPKKKKGQQISPEDEVNIRNLRRAVFKRISMMTSLRKLTVSTDSGERNIMSTDGRVKDKPVCYRSERDGKIYCVYDDPPKDALTMRLDDGLGYIAALHRLEYLGFELMDHKMKNEEIEWIATNLPKLREMRGLLDETYFGIEPNYQNRELKELMMKLRKDIIHTRC